MGRIQRGALRPIAQFQVTDSPQFEVTWRQPATKEKPVTGANNQPRIIDQDRVGFTGLPIFHLIRLLTPERGRHRYL
jgi:hypothetical protein